LSVLVILASCTPDTSHTAFRCDEHHACPSDQACAAGRCRRGAPTGDGIVCDTGLVCTPDQQCCVTLFSAPGRTDSAAIDVTAAITNLRSTCNDAAGQDKLYTEATFDVLARRSDTRGARHVDLPYFSSVMRGGNVVVAKRLGTISLDFADGQDRAQATGKAGSYVDRAQATLPAEIRQRLSKKRRAGDADAATDPLSQPDVKAALAKASFELLVGFQLTDQQLAYNVTR